MFDLAFIDADKEPYPDYFQAVVDRINPGGLILADNVLQSGRITDTSSESANIAALRDFNATVVADPRVEAVLLAAFDGLTFARKLHRKSRT